MRHDMRRPEWMRSVPRTRPLAHEPGQLRTPFEARHEDAIRLGSDQLLRTIWHRHQRIMLTAQALGRAVVIPE